MDKERTRRTNSSACTGRWSISRPSSAVATTNVVRSSSNVRPEEASLQHIIDMSRHFFCVAFCFVLLSLRPRLEFVCHPSVQVQWWRRGCLYRSGRRTLRWQGGHLRGKARAHSVAARPEDPFLVKLQFTLVAHSACPNFHSKTSHQSQASSYLRPTLDACHFTCC